MTVNRSWIVGLMLVLLVLIPPAAQAQGGGGDSAKGQPEGGQKININTASVDELTQLPGIGPKTAQRIVEWRKDNGKFQKVDDLMAVKGIGEKKLARLKPLVTVQ
jgi:competence protein ComEA